MELIFVFSEAIPINFTAVDPGFGKMPGLFMMIVLLMMIMMFEATKDQACQDYDSNSLPERNGCKAKNSGHKPVP
jgi:hypothetical protein